MICIGFLVVKTELTSVLAIKLYPTKAIEKNNNYLIKS